MRVLFVTPRLPSLPCPDAARRGWVASRAAQRYEALSARLAPAPAVEAAG